MEKRTDNTTQKVRSQSKQTRQYNTEGQILEQTDQKIQPRRSDPGATDQKIQPRRSDPRANRPENTTQKVITQKVITQSKQARKYNLEGQILERQTRKYNLEGQILEQTDQKIQPRGSDPRANRPENKILSSEDLAT